MELTDGSEIEAVVGLAAELGAVVRGESSEVFSLGPDGELVVTDPE